MLLFHAIQNWEEGFETIFPALVGTDWELISTLALLIIGIIAGVIVWRSSHLEGSHLPNLSDNTLKTLALK